MHTNPASQSPTRPVRRVCIAGGGTAGWMVAAGLSKCLGSQLEIRLVESEEIGTVGVGEATIPTLHFMHEILDLDEKVFMQATQATFKLGIHFENWRNVNQHYFHSFGKTGQSHWTAGFQHFWLEARQRGLASDYGDYCLELRAALDNRFATLPDNGINYAYHFDATLYGAFLRRFAEDLGVQRVEGKIAHVHTDAATGHITALTLGRGERIEADLFIDCTGMRSLLLGETLGVGYEDWSHWLPCDSAVAVQTALVGEPVPYTRSIAHPWGWQWRIPLQHRVGNGLVYSSRHIGHDEARAALLANVEGEVLRQPRLIRFRPGQRDVVWKHNCVAIGLASGFLEPLESTSIHLIQKGMTRLVQMFPSDGIRQSDVDEYNDQTRTAIENIRDFVILHYHVTERDDSPFWRHCREMEVPPLLKHRIQLFRDSARVMLRPDEMFAENSWVQVMMGQGITPSAHHPIARQMANGALADFLGGVRKDVARTLMKLPKHQAFIRQFCPADLRAEHAAPGAAPNVTAQPAAAALTVQLNPRPTIQAWPLSNGQQAFVIDDFILNARELVDRLTSAAAAFQTTPGHPYPGPRLPAPDTLEAQLDAYFRQHVQPLLGVGRMEGLQACFSRVTQDPATLDARQRLCHRDDTGLDAQRAVSALVHYLFDDEALGGTVFFRPLMPPAETRQLLQDAGRLDGAAFEARHGIPPTYMTDSNRYFECIGRVPPRWNRAVFYDGGIFHSGDIQAFSGERYLHGMGRLTLNAFFQGTRMPVG